MKFLRRFFSVMTLVTLLATVFLPVSAGSADALQQGETALAKAKTLLAHLTPEQRVGQLFLVTFKGRDVSANSQIYDLIVHHYIGGVTLRQANDNFVGPDSTLSNVYTMIADLQRLDWQNSDQGKSSPDAEMPSYIPLFIGISQDGDQFSTDQILSGMTHLPDQLSIGATWNTDLANEVGKVLGQELSNLGVNFIFGPSLDVLDKRISGGGEDISTSTFGGDPYWVGEMGKAYVSGLHTGSGHKLAVIAKHFPGLGAADRPLETEISTIRKSLDQLKQMELQPFFAVTGNAPNTDSTADGLMVSHIRYQGFQGNIRATTRPVSFDQAALTALLKLDALVPWRTNGGLLVSDDLGSKAVRDFFDPNSQNFDARQVARNAFLAGNDLLYMDSFQSTGDPDVHTTIVRTLDFFVQKYREDNVFAQLVDQAVERILTLKFKLYSQFDINNVIPLENNLITIGISQQTPFEIARSSVTLISPDQSELSTLVSHPPEYGEKIVFLTDTIAARQCSNCLAQTFLPVDAMQKDVLRLYGPQTGGQIYEEFLSSYSFDEVSALLASPSQQDKLESDLRSADWVVVSFTGQTTNHPSADAFKRLLAQRPDLLRNKKIYAFSFGSPYYLDSTDISKLTAYYALYSKIPEEIEVAARVLFQELAPKGALPVSVPAIGYDLITITSPDPNQIIPLMVDLPDVNLTLGGATAEPQSTPTSVPVFKSGDTLPIRTGVIIDHNGHPVPDGTVVHFNFILAKDAANLQQIDATTTNGVARTTYRLQKSGPLEIRASSDPANLSQILTLDVTAEGGQVTAIAPTPEPTLTTQPSDTPIATDVPTSNTGTTPGVDRPGFLEWLVTMIMVWSCAYGVYIYGMKTVSVRWGIRWWLATAIGGMLVYLYLAMGLPGTENYFHQTGIWGVILLTFLGALLGWLVGFIWLRRFVSTR